MSGVLLLARAGGILIGAVVLHALVLHAVVFHAVVLGVVAVLMLRRAGAWACGRRRYWVTGPAASSFIPHRGQRPGWSLVTSGCIGQA